MAWNEPGGDNGSWNRGGRQQPIWKMSFAIRYRKYSVYSAAAAAAAAANDPSGACFYGRSRSWWACGA